MTDISRDYCHRVMNAAPFADNDAGIPQMVALIAALRDALDAALEPIAPLKTGTYIFPDSDTPAQRAIAPPDVAQAARVLLDAYDSTLSTDIDAIPMRGTRLRMLVLRATQDRLNPDTDFRLGLRAIAGETP